MASPRTLQLLEQCNTKVQTIAEAMNAQNIEMRALAATPDERVFYLSLIADKNAQLAQLTTQNGMLMHMVVELMTSLSDKDVLLKQAVTRLTRLDDSEEAASQASAPASL